MKAGDIRRRRQKDRGAQGGEGGQGRSQGRMERRRRARRQGQFGRLSVPPDRGQGDDVEEDGAFKVMGVYSGL